MSSADTLFTALEGMCRGRPRQLAETIDRVRAWLTRDRGSRPSGYMNSPKFFSGYAAYHLPLHLPELYWILEQNRERLKLTAPRSVRDLGCGPGTNALSLLLWLEKHKFHRPEQLDLVDLSANALKNARFLIGALSDTPVETFRENLFHRHTRSARRPADWLLMGHVLNEMGNGPRFRRKKTELLTRLLQEHLAPGGLAFIIEPPLREPTMDLMALRDAIAQDHSDLFEVLAPCPSGTRHCPMLKHSLGWCYAQPPRKWGREAGLTQWDHEIEDTFDIELTNPGFSYLIIRNAAMLDDAKPAHRISVSDDSQRKGKICTGKDIRDGNVSHRGQYLGLVKT